jgi:alpha(1,3/1,4) fucosyltransferase
MRKILIYPYSEILSIDALIQSDNLVGSLVTNLKNECSFEILRINYFNPNNIKNADLVIVQRLDLKIIPYLLYTKLMNRTIYLAYEPHNVLPLNRTEFMSKLSTFFMRIYSMNDSLTKQYNISRLNTPMNVKIEDISIDTFDAYNSRDLLTQISSNKNNHSRNSLYNLRRKLNVYFCNKIPETFKFYGRGWSSESGCYGGEVENKLEILKKYKFNICFENTNEIAGYVSEKIYDSFMGSCVPIYYGAPNIEDYIPKNCFIDYRDYKSNDELLAYLKSIDYKTYKTYLLNIRKFLSSKEYLRTNLDSLVNNILDIILTSFRTPHNSDSNYKFQDLVLLFRVYIRMSLVVLFFRLRGILYRFIILNFNRRLG